MTTTSPSILAYLQVGPGKITLRLNPSATPIAPFSFLDDGLDPLARLLQGAFVTDSGAVIKEVNLLLQRDRVACVEDTLPGLTNFEVEQYWRRSMKMRRARAPEHTLLLGMQIDGQGELLPFASLFYCKKKAIFFEPPCPACGQPLQLCRDDAQLRSVGLAPYSTGLCRYLFCPSCCQKTDPQVWYTLERKDDDPTIVHDARTLLQDFGGLGVGGPKSERLPCLSCQQHAVCYGPQQDVHTNIFILAFYPFYMLLMDRDSLDGFHFLTLRRKGQLGTDSPETLQKDRVSEERASDRPLHTLLDNIARKWRQEETRSSPAESAAFLAETVMQQRGEELGKTVPVGEMTLDETLVLGNTRAAIEEIDDLSMETVLIAPPAEQSIVQTSTVLFSGSALSDSPCSSETSPCEKTSLDTIVEQDDELAETIILRPDGKE
ncbi:MAG: hypothetical protein QTN59_09985 [Candidatus Electrothrix communis]|nr:MAG: hypothetical protein QTN59_09985 [Candidatus Electrothrix communis]